VVARKIKRDYVSETGDKERVTERRGV